MAGPGRAEAACGELRDALPGLFTAIEHVGSTAVPGLPAKPVIDLMAAVVSLDQVTARPYHLHVVPAASWPARNERLLRDYLRTHPVQASGTPT